MDKVRGMRLIVNNGRGVRLAVNNGHGVCLAVNNGHGVCLAVNNGRELFLDVGFARNVHAENSLHRALKTRYLHGLCGGLLGSGRRARNLD